MLRETCSCFTFTVTHGLMAASSKLSEEEDRSTRDVNPSETASAIVLDRR